MDNSNIQNDNKFFSQISDYYDSANNCEYFQSFDE